MDELPLSEKFRDLQHFLSQGARRRVTVYIPIIYLSWNCFLCSCLCKVFALHTFFFSISPLFLVKSQVIDNFGWKLFAVACWDNPVWRLRLIRVWREMGSVSVSSAPPQSGVGGPLRASGFSARAGCIPVFYELSAANQWNYVSAALPQAVRGTLPCGPGGRASSEPLCLSQEGPQDDHEFPSGLTVQRISIKGEGRCQTVSSRNGRR